MENSTETSRSLVHDLDDPTDASIAAEIEVVELDERIEFGVGILSEDEDDDEFNGFCPNKQTCNSGCC